MAIAHAWMRKARDQFYGPDGHWLGPSRIGSMKQAGALQAGDFSSAWRSAGDAHSISVLSIVRTASGRLRLSERLSERLSGDGAAV